MLSLDAQTASNNHLLDLIRTFIDLRDLCVAVHTLDRISIGMITPPLGVNLYVAAGLKEGVKVDQVINKHLIIYLLAMISVLLILTFVPGISTLIPSLLATTN